MEIFRSQNYLAATRCDINYELRQIFGYKTEKKKKKVISWWRWNKTIVIIYENFSSSSKLVPESVPHRTFTKLLS